MKTLAIACGAIALCGLAAQAGPISPNTGPRPFPILGTIEMPSEGGPRGPDVIYSNVTTSSLYAFAWCDGGQWIGEDIHVSKGGVLEGLKFSVAHKPTPGGGGADDPLMSCEMVLQFCDIGDPTMIFAGPLTLSLDFSSIGGLKAGYVSHFDVTGLSTQGVNLNRNAFVLNAHLINRQPLTTGPLGQDMYDPPTVGTSQDHFWFDETGCNPPQYDLTPGWYYFVGNPIANFYWEISVVEAGSITFPVTVIPDLKVPAKFQVDPADDSDPPQGGLGNPLSTPIYLLYDPPKDIDFYYPELVVGGTPRKFLGWFFRASSPFYDKSVGAPTYKTTFPVGTDQFNEAQIVFNTELSVAAEKVDGTPQTVLARFTDRKTVTTDPPYEGDPIKDINGLGDGTTPLLRKWNPVDIGAEIYDYYQWVCVYTPAQLTDGTPFLKYVLTRADGTVEDFFNPDYPGRVCLRVDVFVKAVSIYGTQAAFEHGDANCDGKIDAFDIDPFVKALTDLPGWQGLYCDGDIYSVDINGDTKVDAFDIDPFVECLTVGCP